MKPVVIGDATLYNAPCEEVFPLIGRVDAVITDPPYGTAGGMGKGEERYERIGNATWDVALSPEFIYGECNRILRQSGVLVLFSQEPYTSRLVTDAHKNVPFSYRMIWLKDHFSNSLVANTAPVSYFEDIAVFFKKHDDGAAHPLRAYAKTVMSHIGKGIKAINADLGHRRAEHFFYVDSMQFSMCTQETYGELVGRYALDNQDWFMSYERLAAVDKSFGVTFNLQPGKNVKSNIFQYRKDRNGFHPTQKPVALMADLIETYTNVGDSILDFTMGSGSTGVAAIELGRKFIGIERDPKYFDIAYKRIEQAVTQGRLFAPEPSCKQEQSALFEDAA